MSHEITSVTFRIKAQSHKKGQFSVPKKVCELLGLADGDSIYLVVQAISGALIFDGETQLRSGREIYGDGFGEIGAGQLIDVTASKPS